MVRTARSLLNRALERMGLRFFSSPQSYEVEYAVTIRNRVGEMQQVSVVAPCRPITPAQKSLTDIVSEPQAGVQRESRFGNSYAVWKVELGSSPVVLRQRFQCQISPVALSDLPHWTVADYENLDSVIYAPYLEPNRFIQQTEEIRQLAKKIVEGEQDVVQMLQKINRYVIDHLTYGKPIDGLYSASEALSNVAVDCGGYDSFYCSLAMAVGIPSRVVSGFWAGYPKNEMHAWAESVLPDGRWLPVDPSVEQLVAQGRSQKSGSFGSVGSDRIVSSYGCDYDLRLGEKLVRCDILQHPLVIADRGADSIQVSLSFSAKRL